MCFWVLQLCFHCVETDPKLDSEKAAFVSVFRAVLRGVRVVGGVTIYIYIYTFIYRDTDIQIQIYGYRSIDTERERDIYIYTHIYIYRHRYIQI